MPSDTDCTAAVIDAMMAGHCAEVNLYLHLSRPLRSCCYQLKHGMPAAGRDRHRAGASGARQPSMKLRVYLANIRELLTFCFFLRRSLYLAI